MDVATISLQDAGIRKAAILVASLDRAAADLLMQRLGPERANLVRQAVKYLDDVGGEERQRIVDEFRRISPLVPGPSVSGIELDRLPASHWGKTALSAMDQAEGPAASEGDDARPFAFLHEAEDEKLAGLLCSERPPTVALVLSHLPPERAGEVMARLTPALQVEVVRRLAEMQSTDPESLREVERVLQSRWLQQFAIERGRDAGPESVAKILAACDPATRGQILDNLAVHDRQLAEQFGERPIAFEELGKFADAALLAVYRAAEPEVARLAFLGATPALVERLLRLMPPREAKRLRHRLAHPGPICLSDVEEARRRIAALAQQMSRSSARKAA
jgi:flagellar motor switch protein FliG